MMRASVRTLSNFKPRPNPQHNSNFNNRNPRAQNQQQNSGNARYIRELQQCVNTGNSQQAFQLLERVESEREHLSADCYLLTAQAAIVNRQPLHIVNSLWERMESARFSPTIKYHHSILTAFAACGDGNNAVHWFGKLQREYGLQPNSQAYTAVISAFAKSGEVDKANFWLEQSSTQNCLPDVYGWGSIIHTFSRNGNLQVALHWLDLMAKHGIEAQASTYNAILTSAGVAMSSEIFTRMLEHNVEPDDRTFNILIDTAAKSDDPISAGRWFETMRNHNCHPDLAGLVH